MNVAQLQSDEQRNHMGPTSLHPWLHLNGLRIADREMSGRGRGEGEGEGQGQGED